MEQTFTISLYNKKVRDALERGDGETLTLDPQWADLRYVEIIAHNQDQAKRKINAKYPPRQGFVIREIVLEKEFE